MADFSAMLTFRKVKSLDRFVQVELAHTTYGIKNTKSQIDVELLYENSLAHTDDTNEDNRLVCGAGDSSKKLDF